MIIYIIGENENRVIEKVLHGYGGEDLQAVRDQLEYINSNIEYKTSNYKIYKVTLNVEEIK